MTGRVLVTGAAGAMGSRLVHGLAAAGWVVRALVLPGDPLRSRIAGIASEVVEGDVTDAAAMAAACVGVDTVYHLAAVIIAHDSAVFRRVNRDGTAHMVVAAASAGVRHFIYVSSASVTYPRLTAYGQSKLDAEDIVKSERGFQYTIVRPTLVYDQTGGQEFAMFRAYLQRFPVVPFIGPGHAKKSPVFSGDVVAGLLALAGNDRAHGKTYNFAGGEAIEVAELARLMLAQQGVSKRFVHVPVALCRAAAAVLGRVMAFPPLTLYTIAAMLHDADLDCGPAAADLGYRPLGVREGFRKCFGTKETRS